MIAGVALEDWKLPVFRERLTEAGYKYEDGGSLFDGTTLLQVVIPPNGVHALTTLLKKCQQECKRQRRG